MRLCFGKKFKSKQLTDPLNNLLLNVELADKDGIMGLDMRVFQINFDDLNIQKEIGCGGSGAVVFKVC